MGEDLQDEGRLIETVYTDTMTVNAFIIKTDSVATLNSDLMLAGSCKDDVLNAKYYAEAYSRMFITKRDTFDISYVNFRGTRYPTTYDSLSFALRYKTFYGDTTVEQYFDIYQLAEEVKDSVPYFNNSVLPVSRKIGTAKYSGKDEKDKYLRCRLSDEVGREFFSKSGSTEFQNEKNFNAYFKGIKIAPRERKNAAVLGLDLIDDEGNLSGILLHYHYKRPKDNGTGDTLIRLTYGIGFGWRYNYFENDLSGNSRLAGIQKGVDLNSDLNDKLCVIQPINGFAVRLEFPYIKHFYEKMNRQVLFHRVSLQLTPVESSLSRFWLPPPSIRLLFANPDGTPQRTGSAEASIPREGDSRSTATMFFTPNGWAYTDVKISSYMQAVANGTVRNNGLILKGSEQERSVNRLLFYNAKGGSFPLKMHVYYTYRK